MNGHDQEETAAALELVVSPSGGVRLEAARDGDVPLPRAVARRIADAFARGDVHGVMHLGAAEVATPLPTGLGFFRDFGRLFVSRLCARPADASTTPLEVSSPTAEELEGWVQAAPPLHGGEYLSTEALSTLWTALEAAARAEIGGGSVEAWLKAHDPAWNQVGRVCLHLAENKDDPDAPFAFLATYTTRLSDQGRPQHAPLGRALEEYAGARNKAALLALLQPVQRATEHSALVRELVESGEIFHPLAWSPDEALRFLREVPAIEAAGLTVRVPDWWRARRRVRASVTVGTAAPVGIGTDALLDFRVGLALDGDEGELSAAEWKAIQQSTSGLALIRGQWVEVDRDRLGQVLSHWGAVQAAVARDGLTFAEAMRLMAGAAPGSDNGAARSPERAASGWGRVVAGEWLREVLAALCAPETLAPIGEGGELRATLRTYQEVGVRWLWLLSRLGLGACLADDMGLGKTIQVLALLLTRRRQADAGGALLVVPASLIGNWRDEIARFAPTLRVLVAHPSVQPAAELSTLPAGEIAAADHVITSYGSAHRLAWLRERAWGLVVLDEAQAIKNASARQTRVVKALRARARVALTGTPVENRLSDLWSLFDFLNPGLLGSAAELGRFAKALSGGERGAFAPLRALVRPYLLRRLKSDRRIIADLPDKTEVRAFCGLTRKQAVLYQEAVDALAARLRVTDRIERRGAVLASLMRLKQICNHPSQWLSDGAYAAEESGKHARLSEICEVVAARQEKVLVFTQFREMTAPLATWLERLFGRPGMVLSGQTVVKQRQELVRRFQDDERVPFFVLSLKAGGTGLNLTAAAHVIHFDRWWNPAVEDQATDRAYRIGQRRNVLVHKLVCRGTVEERVDALIEAKRGMAGELLGGGDELPLTELSDQEILRLVSLDLGSALAQA